MLFPEAPETVKFHRGFVLPPHFFPGRGLCVAVCNCKTTNNFRDSNKKIQKNERQARPGEDAPVVLVQILGDIAYDPGGYVAFAG